MNFDNYWVSHHFLFDFVLKYYFLTLYFRIPDNEKMVGKDHITIETTGIIK